MKDKNSKGKYSLRIKLIGFNLTITFVSLLLCGAVFVGSVWIIMGKYIDKDVEFFLQETSNNLNAKIVFLEDIIFQIRDNSDIMDYLKKNQEKQYSEQELKEIEKKYSKEVDINNQKNTCDNGNPIIEKAYLFYNEKDYMRVCYFSMIYSELEKSDASFKKIYSMFKNQNNKGEMKEDYKYFADEDKNYIYLAFTIYDDSFVDVGTIIYGIRKDSLGVVMHNIEDYKDAFWVAYDLDGKVLTGENQDVMKKSELEEIRNIWELNPYEHKISDTVYRIYSQDMSMNMSATIGIPKNQLLFLMYDSIQIYLFLIVLITIVTLGFTTIVIYRMTRPLKEVTDKIKLVEEGKFDTKLPEYNSKEFYEISTVFNAMTTYVNNLIKEVYEKQLAIREMELKFLQSQMNPHFMFNILNTISLKSKLDGNEEVSKMISAFSRLIQATIYRKENEKVEIKQELKYVDYYLYLQSYRYEERLRYTITIEDENILNMYIPKLCIQLIVENAVVHGVEPKSTNSSVDIRLYSEEDTIYIEIMDDGVGFEEDGEIELPLKAKDQNSEHNRVGLNNAYNIIQLMYGPEYGIKIVSEKNKGTIVCLKIPFDRGDNWEGITCSK